MNFSGMSIKELLLCHSEVLRELRQRDVLRSRNNPTGDLAEWMVTTKPGLRFAPKSEKGFDAVDKDGLTYQIKGRHISSDKGSVQLGVIRDLNHETKPFDYLVAVIFEEDWDLRYVAKIPHGAVERLATFKKHVNGVDLAL